MIKIETEKEIEKNIEIMQKKPMPNTFNRHIKKKSIEYLNENNNISYRINTNDFYIVHKGYCRGKPVYMIPVRKRYYNYWRYGYKPIRFNRDVELEDKSIIKIISGFEDLDIKNTYGKQHKYTTSIIVITEFELYETPEVLEKKAIKDYELQKRDKFAVHR